MSVILDALKRVQDESRRQKEPDAPPPASGGKDSDALLRRLSTDAEQPRRFRWQEISPAVWVFAAAVGVLATVAVGLWWLMPNSEAAPAAEPPPLLADLLGDAEPGAGDGSGSSSAGEPGSRDPGRAVGAVPTGASRTINEDEPPFLREMEEGEPDAAGPEATQADPAEAAETDGPDLSDLSSGLQGGGDAAGAGESSAAASVAADAEEGYIEFTANEVQAAPALPQVRVPSRSAPPVSSQPGASTSERPVATVPRRLVDPEVQDAFQRGVQAQRAGDLVGAERAYERALKYDPQNAKVHANLGVLYRSAGDYDLAERHLRASLSVAPNNASARNNLGVVLYSRGNFEAALSEFKRTLALDPRLIDAYTNMGLIYTRWGDYVKAENAFLQALSIDPMHALTHYNLGLVYEEQGRLEEAMERYEHFLDLGGSDHPEITRHLLPHLEWLEARSHSGRYRP